MVTPWCRGDPLSRDVWHPPDDSDEVEVKPDDVVQSSRKDQDQDAGDESGGGLP